MVKNFNSVCAIIAIVIFSLGMKSYGGEIFMENMIYKTPDEVPASQWNSLSQKRIFFGHQSVGNNIVTGMEEIIAANKQIKIPIRKIENAPEMETKGFSHSHIGKNNDPVSKIDEFAQMVRKANGRVDIAFVKFCFVDIESDTDIQKLFNYYKEEMAKLKKDYPNTLFVHFTVPLLKKMKPTIKSRITKVIKGKGTFFDNEHNIARNDYNNLLLNEYKGVEPVFDIAEIESSYADGNRETFEENSNVYYSLAPDYTEDGGHLNEKGRRWVSGNLLVFLAKLDKK